MDQRKMVVGCELCGALGNLLRCSGCKGVYYCSKEHQRLHWMQHKTQCNKRSSSSSGGGGGLGVVSLSNNISPPTTNTDSSLSASQFAAIGGDGSSSVWTHDDQQLDFVVDALTGKLSSSMTVPSIGSIGNDWRQQQEQLTRVTTDSSFHLYARHEHTGGGPRSLREEPSTLSSVVEPPYLHRNVKLAPTEVPVNNSHWVHAMCQYIIRDMDNYGICVIDNFVGHKMGMSILHEVLAMYDSGQFVDGKLMNNPSENFSRTIRGDKILWVTGQESHCKNIGYLVKLVDAIVLNSNRMPDNGKLGQYTVSDRSKAMVACYPGHGTQYVKHVDNPNKDGRCITSIYYLNQDWDVKRDGGLLRIFPRDWPQVADIEPVFDRILFFWSDRRNPHEVQPALRTRYAITLWYNDKVEKEAALRHLHGD